MPVTITGRPSRSATATAVPMKSVAARGAPTGCPPYRSQIRVVSNQRAAMIYLHATQGADRRIADSLPVQLDGRP